jgi:bifunctional enzyme CysN/CysC
VALVLVDATKGVLTQTRRHAFVCRLLGIRRLLLLVNKMDLVDYDRGVFDRIVAEFGSVAEDFEAIPIAAASGDNIVHLSSATPWYEGPPLLERLESVEPESSEGHDAFLMPVQGAVRTEGFRGVSGLIASGRVRCGGPVWVMPAVTPAKVSRILLGGADLETAEAGQSVTISFATEIDCSRGDVLAHSAYGAPDVADQFEATIVWLGHEELVPGRQYALKLATQSCLATLQPPEHEVNIATLEPVPAKTLALNGIGLCDLWTDKPLVFTPYEENRDLGGFILIDRLTNDTVGAGLIRHALRRSSNVQAQPLQVSREARAGLKGQKPRLLWFTGLSGAGKSTIANLVEAKLHARGRHTFLLDGDNVRLGLTRDLGFSEADRAENIRRVGETARLMLDSGLIVLAAFISPYRAERRMVREMLPEGEFVEIFVDATLEEAERRDPKGLYAKARAGRIPNFTGIGSPYEAPEAPELRLDTTTLSAEDAADAILRYLEEEG